MLGLGLKIPRMIINSYNFSSTDYSPSYLFMTSPTPRQEIGDGDTINLTVEAENASSVTFYYLNLSDTWVSIGSATNTSGDTWTYSSFNPSVEFTAIKATVTYPDATTADVVNNIHGLSLYDTFTDTNGTALSAHTSDSELGGAWVIESGNWEIQSNELDINSADTSLHFATTDLGQSDNVYIEFDLGFIGSPTGIQGVVLRWIDADNHILFYVNNNGRPTLAHRTSGSVTTIAQGSDGDIVADETIKVVLIDDFIYVLDSIQTRVSGEVTQHPTGTKYGVLRGGADYATYYDDVKIVPLSMPVTDSSVSYTPSKLGSLVISKGGDSPNDTQAVGGHSFYQVGSTNYIVYAVRNSSGDWAGLQYATAPTSDIHNWTRNSGISLSSGSESIADCSTYWDGSTLYVLYSDRLTGKIHYATGANIGSLTKQGVLIDETSSSIYLRHPNLVVRDGVWYIFVDVRLGQPAGEYGYVGMYYGSSLGTLGSLQESLSNEAYGWERADVGSPSVRYNPSNGYWEMLYLGYDGSGIPYPHDIGLAIATNPKNKFVRAATTPLISRGGASSIDEQNLIDPEWYLDNDIVYYVCQDTTTDVVSSEYDGITYATLS